MSEKQQLSVTLFTSIQIMSVNICVHPYSVWLTVDLIVKAVFVLLKQPYLTFAAGLGWKLNCC